MKTAYPSPEIVTIYNGHMGGADLIDSQVCYHQIKVRSKKWYYYLFFYSFLRLDCYKCMATFEKEGR